MLFARPDHLGFLVAFAVGSTLPGTLTAHAPPCSAEEHRQFDFWIGSWRVETPSGQVAGYITIERTNDCFLHESYATPTGYAGESFNIYDSARGLWHQSWVDNTGLLLRLDGGLVGDEMVLQGPGTAGDGTPVVNRITWSVVSGDPNHVRQLWETSGDGGTTWVVAFDGHYQRED